MAAKPQVNKQRVPEIPVKSTAASNRFAALVPFLERHSRVLAVALILIATVRIFATYSVFSYTSDEPAHIASGVEWLANGKYTWEPQHPPLARVAAALGPYLIGARPHNTPRDSKNAIGREGVAILFGGNAYDLTIALARLGILPFFWIACLVVYWWGLRYFGAAVAVTALFFFSSLPAVLAHAGLATTDMAVTAFVGAAFLAAAIWAEQPTLWNGALFGICTGLAVLTKFSALAYLPAAIAVSLICLYFTGRFRSGQIAQGVRERLPSLGLAIFTGCLAIWAMYRFSFGPSVFGFSLPAPELYAGIEQVMRHNSEGHPSYLLGHYMQNGVWYYFPLVLAIKTPIGFLLLLGLGVALAFRDKGALRNAWLPLAFSVGILAVGLCSHINIGIRHVLPIYIGLALLAGVAARHLLEMAKTRTWASALLAISILWFAGSSLLSHPDYLPYFNELAGSHPENIVVDSDLDWGQDMKRLGARLQQTGAKQLSMLVFLRDLPQGAFGLPPIPATVDALKPMPGWNAVSLSMWKETRLGLLYAHPEYTPWPEIVPAPGERIGKGILLWYFEP